MNREFKIICSGCGRNLAIDKRQHTKYVDILHIHPCQKCSKDLNILTSAEPITEQDLDNLAWWRNGD